MHVITFCSLSCGVLWKGFRQEQSSRNYRNWELHRNDWVNRKTEYWVFPLFSWFFHNLELWTLKDYRNDRRSHINFHPQPTQSASPHNTKNSTDLIIKIPSTWTFYNIFSDVTLCLSVAGVWKGTENCEPSSPARLWDCAVSETCKCRLLALVTPSVHNSQSLTIELLAIESLKLLFGMEAKRVPAPHSWRCGTWLHSATRCLFFVQVTLLRASLRVTAPVGANDLVTCPTSCNGACWCKWPCYLPHFV